MQQWEYLVLEISGSSGVFYVKKVNGQDVGGGGGFMKSNNYPHLWSYLNSLGTEGWEVTCQIVDFMILCKRPKARS